MKVLVAGEGGAAHDLCWRLTSARAASEVHAPACGARAAGVRRLPFDRLDPDLLVSFAETRGLDLVAAAPGSGALAGRLVGRGWRRVDLRFVQPEDIRPELAAVVSCLRAARVHGWELLLRTGLEATEPVPHLEGGVPACTVCGACCASLLRHYAPVTEADLAHLHPAERERLVLTEEGGGWMRMRGGRCTALALEGGRLACSIYERRPQVCRDFPAAGPRCRVARDSRHRLPTVDPRRPEPSPRVLRSVLLAWRPGVDHGFTTRLGGVSVGPLESLNLARRPGEDPDALVENWRRALADVGPDLAPASLALVGQVHGREVLTVERPSGPLAVVGEADALVTTRPGLALAVRTADCVPILLAAPGVVAAVHAGWRGVTAGVVPAAVAALVEAGGTGPETVAAAIGPHISAPAFEVGEEVVSALQDAGLDPTQFLFRPRDGGRPHVDLGAAVTEQLLRAGVAEVERLEASTADERFFSHRGDGPGTGRQAAIVALRA